ncbi:MAG: PSP1 domain-containing protein [Caldisericia bacterium]
MYRYIYVKLIYLDKKIYLCEVGQDVLLNKYEKVVIEKDKCEEVGEVRSNIIESEEKKESLCKFIRILNQEDEKNLHYNINLEKKALEICKTKIIKYGLNMNLILSHYSLDRKKLTFYFTADSRIDFRNLVKDLAATFKTRIELWQIGPRDEVKIVGGIGDCGRELCCSKFLSDFKTITLEMARKQSLNVNPNKISGICGRLKCCLYYELPIYEELETNYPLIEEEVEVEGKRGKVFSLSPFKGTVFVEFSDGIQKEYKIEEIKRLK